MTQQEVLADALAPWRGLTRETYEAMIDAGLLEGAPVELLEGVLVEVSPQGPEHGYVTARLNRHLALHLPTDWELRPQLPLSAGERSVPEPDLAVARPSTPDAHPTTAVLAIEVAVSSQRKDLTTKARVYGAAGVTAYWVVDVPRREVVVHTGPRDDGYTSVVRQPWSQPLSVPVGDGVPVDLAALLD